ncbi:MAG TPA: hypothetical protein VLW84_09960 [Terriglobales bacterium]|nr:hypothetical protein [Terriglobales bacterium]
MPEISDQVERFLNSLPADFRDAIAFEIWKKCLNLDLQERSVLENEVVISRIIRQAHGSITSPGLTL